MARPQLFGRAGRARGGGGATRNGSKLQVAAGMFAGTDLLRGNVPVPIPLTKPRRTGQIVNTSEAGVTPDDADLPDVVNLSKQ